METADSIIGKLELKPHREGGYYREMFRDEVPGGRARSTAILYLLKAGEVSRWHRVDAVEIWHWHGGAPLEISQSDGNGVQSCQILGGDVMADQMPQIIIPEQIWQTARSLGQWTLVGCTVAPGFEFDGFEMAPSGWQP